MKRSLLILFTLIFAIEAPQAISTDKATLLRLHKDMRVKAFLDLLAHGEGTSYHPDAAHAVDQYRMTFCGKMRSFKDHPRIKCCNPVGNRVICATASGRYMFLQKTWDWVSEKIDAHDFSPQNQDLAAIYLLIYSGAMEEILRNNIPAAMRKASRYWAPIPGNNYQQPQTKNQELMNIYNKRLLLYKKNSKAINGRAEHWLTCANLALHAN